MPSISHFLTCMEYAFNKCLTFNSCQTNRRWYMARCPTVDQQGNKDRRRQCCIHCEKHCYCQCRALGLTGVSLWLRLYYRIISVEKIPPLSCKEGKTRFLTLSCICIFAFIYAFIYLLIFVLILHLFLFIYLCICIYIHYHEQNTI